MALDKKVLSPSFAALVVCAPTPRHAQGYEFIFQFCIFIIRVRVQGLQLSISSNPLG
jgi:hypothetical protein